MLIYPTQERSTGNGSTKLGYIYKYNNIINIINNITI